MPGEAREASFGVLEGNEREGMALTFCFAAEPFPPTAAGLFFVLVASVCALKEWKGVKILHDMARTHP